MDFEELINLIKINDERANKKVSDYLLSKHFFISFVNLNKKYPAQSDSDYNMEQLIKNAISAKNTVIFELILDRGCYGILQVGDDRYTIAAYSFLHDNIEFLEKILNKIPNILICKAFGSFPISKAAIKNGDLDTIKILSKHNYKFHGEHLHEAVRCGKLDIIKYFTEDLKIDIEAKDDEGYSPMQRSILEQNLEIINYLIEAGAKVILYNNQQNNILLDLMSTNINSSLITGINFAAEVKLKFKILARIAFVKFCQDQIDYLKISEDSQQQIRNYIEYIIKDKKFHAEIDRELFSLFYARPAQTTKNMITTCKIKFYPDACIDSEKPIEIISNSLPDNMLFVIANDIIHPSLEQGFINVSLSGDNQM